MDGRSGDDRRLYPDGDRRRALLGDVILLGISCKSGLMAIALGDLDLYLGDCWFCNVRLGDRQLGGGERDG